MHSRFLFILAACLLAAVASLRADDLRALRAVAATESTEVHPDDVFDVTLSLQNLTNTVQTIKIPNIAWDRTWKSSNHHVTWDPWDSDEKDQITVQIPARGTYVFPKPLRMFVDDSVKPSRIDFRMGFKTTAFGKTLWSSPITLDVTQ